MPSLKVDQIKQVLKGGVRSNLFQIAINPSGVGTNVPPLPFGDNGKNLSILVRAGQIPAATVTPIEVPFRGARFKTMGERTFEPWTMTVYNDQDMQVRGFFEEWSNAMKGFVSNKGEQDPDTLFGIVSIFQLNMAGEYIGQPWVLHDCWPSDISAIDLSNDAEGALSEFSVTWQYQYWTHQPFTDGPNIDVNNAGL